MESKGGGRQIKQSLFRFLNQYPPNSVIHCRSVCPASSSSSSSSSAAYAANPTAFDFPYSCQRTWKVFIIHTSGAVVAVPQQRNIYKRPKDLRNPCLLEIHSSL